MTVETVNPPYVTADSGFDQHIATVISPAGTDNDPLEDFLLEDDERRFRQERRAFQRALSTLLTERPGEYVAFHEGRPRVFGASATEVSREFSRQFGDAHVYIGFIGHEPPAYQIRPRR